MVLTKNHTKQKNNNYTPKRPLKIRKKPSYKAYFKPTTAAQGVKAKSQASKALTTTCEVNQLCVKLLQHRSNIISEKLTSTLR